MWNEQVPSAVMLRTLLGVARSVGFLANNLRSLLCRSSRKKPVSARRWSSEQSLRRRHSLVTWPGMAAAAQGSPRDGAHRPQVWSLLCNVVGAALACRCDGEWQRNVVRLIFAHSAQPCASDQGPWPSVLPLWGDSETNTVGDMKRNKKNISNVKKLRVSLMPWSNRPRKAGLKIDSSAPSCGCFWQNTGILNLLRTQPVIHGLECCWLNTKINVFVIT